MLFEHCVEVGASETKRADPRSPNLFEIVPGLELGVHVERNLTEPDLGIGRPETDARRQLLVMQGKGGLEQAGCSRGSLEMSDVRFDRPDRNARRRQARVREGVDHALYLDHIAYACRRAMTFDQAHRSDILPGMCPGAFDRKLLPDRVGCGDPLALAVARPADTSDHRVDLVAGLFGVFESLEKEDRRPFAHHEPIGTLIIRSSSGRR